MAERADVGRQAVLHLVHRAATREPRDERLVGRAVGGDERLGGQDAGGERLLDDVLALGQELAQLAPPPRRLEAAGVLQPLVLPRGDQAARAAFAATASASNAFGSETAMSARTLRSSSISAFRSPNMNWLYDRPCWRAPAWMRLIQGRRKSRLRVRRSR